MIGTAEASTHRVAIRRGFIAEDERLTLLNFARRPTTAWVRLAPGDPWDARTIVPHLCPDQIAGLMRDIRARIVAAIEAHYGLTEPLYPDVVNLTRWRPGEFQAPHADRENMDGSPHPFPWRDYGCVLYLNDDFEGGEVYFPLHDLQPKITPGMLAFFPGDLEHLHGVKPVRDGVRYTLSCFLTHDASKKEWDYV